LYLEGIVAFDALAAIELNLAYGSRPSEFLGALF
jgi:hypothetical protein